MTALPERKGLPRLPGYYGWWMVGFGILMSTLSGGLYTYGFGAFFLPLINEFGWTRAQLAGVISLARLEGGVLAPLIGYLSDRLGPRRLMMTGMGMMGLGFLLFSQVNSLVMLYAVFLLSLSTGASMMGLPSQAAISNWFIRRRARALGFVSAGFGLGGALVPLLSWAIESFGWRTAAMICAGLAWGIGIPLASMFRRRPEEHGLMPDNIRIGVEEAGSGKQDSAADFAAARAALEAESAKLEGYQFTLKEALHTRTFWMFAVTWIGWAMVDAIVTVHQIPHLVNVGYAPQTAAFILGAYAAFSAPTRIVIGWLGDIYPKRVVLTVCFVGQAVGLSLLSSVTEWWHVVLFILIFAPAFGGSVPLRGAIQAEYFGRRHYGAIAGTMRIPELLGTVTGPIFAGWMFDQTGSYELGFRIVAGLSLIGAASMFLAPRPRATYPPAPLP